MIIEFDDYNGNLKIHSVYVNGKFISVKRRFNLDSIKSIRRSYNFEKYIHFRGAPIRLYPSGAFRICKIKNDTNLDELLNGLIDLIDEDITRFKIKRYTCTFLIKDKIVFKENSDIKYNNLFDGRLKMINHELGRIAIYDDKRVKLYVTCNEQNKDNINKKIHGLYEFVEKDLNGRRSKKIKIII